MKQKKKPKLYLIGSLRNPNIPKLERKLTKLGFDVFASWYAAGPKADDYWKKFEQGRGLTFKQALRDFAANNVFNFDFKHLKAAKVVVLALPAGKSGHMEFLWALSKGKKGFILIHDPKRWDVMYLLAVKVAKSFDVICENFGELKKMLLKFRKAWDKKKKGKKKI